MAAPETIFEVFFGCPIYQSQDKKGKFEERSDDFLGRSNDFAGCSNQQRLRRTYSLKVAG